MDYTESENRRMEIVRQQATRSGLRGKVNAKCVECIYDPVSGDGNWRQQVESCTDTACPLFEVRPVSHPRSRGRQEGTGTG